MHCVRHYLALLCVASGGSAFFTLSLLLSTTLQHRPCAYCSVILLILIFTSSYWRDAPLLEFTTLAGFFDPVAWSTSTTATASTTTQDAAATVAMEGVGCLRRWMGGWSGELYNGRFLRIVL
ncbi:hypothetical protein BCR37DRAFT_162349 [Protomyces lactucae-debilis]|uniref:Uncharacterized protein n=1 Tax=Protomyces lactucae-debilis TaxID=2754530 RepID=A0A1Y2EYJ6_PROLT|nr:uncharacterized protein BCR37DRAFT_162349 [Protomyces lactucae-debilis]ORY76640.1 hypothetical protein BCR37DRAFT_162349 [Protomyces lactucae-debilis]